jgi:hypothetical protein
MKSAPGPSGPHEPIGEAIGLALRDRTPWWSADRPCSRAWLFPVQYEAGRLHLLENGCRVNPMKRLGVARARPAAAACLR